MDASTILELFGYLGSLIVIVSMLMTSVVKLRVINTIGSLLFALYALLIHSYPTMVMNLFLAGINIWHLMKLRNTEKHYDIVRINPSDDMFRHFLDNFNDDIARYFPGFSTDATEGCSGYIVMCQSSLAGVFLARPSADPAGQDGEVSDVSRGRLDVILDYTTPAYRDCSVGKFLYGILADMGYTGLEAGSKSADHIRYLRKMGFEQSGDTYILTLKR